MPPIEIEVLDDRSAHTPSDQGFLKVRRLTLRTRYEDGTESAPYRYDVADRDALDAVLIVLHAPREDAPDDPYLCMRTALRPPLALRRQRALPVPDAHTEPVLWELPAGLIEQGEQGEQAVLETAAREAEEETGFALPPQAFARLGAAVYLSPGLSGEKLHVVHAAVDRSQQGKATATEVVEQASRIEWWPLSEALDRAARGELEDCKTELALHRLRAWLSTRSPR
jgi:ADP-ribose pyrophosphatase